MRLYEAKNKKVLRIKNGATDFLYSFSSNSADASRGAFLDLGGNIVAAFEQVFVNREEALIALERQFTDRLLGHLDKYLKLGDTVIHEEDYRVYVDPEGRYAPAEDEYIIFLKGPEAKSLPPLLLVTSKELPAGVGEEEWTLFRLKNNLPVQGVDYDREMVLNVNEDLVSYTKGCYLGQEIVARVHYRGKPPKQLAVKSLEECTPGQAAAMTSKAADPATGKTIGFVFVNKP